MNEIKLEAKDRGVGKSFLKQVRKQKMVPAVFYATHEDAIPIAFDECCRTGKIKEGDKVVFVAFGAGLTWGAAVIQF